MKNKILKLIPLFIIFFALQVSATENISITFEQEPLFSNANLVPGQTVTRWVKVENISDEKQKIAIKAINFCVCGQVELCLNNVLFLEIKQNQKSLYYDSLNNFFNLNEVFLSELNNKNKTQYNFSVYFDEQANNEYQNLTTCFDLIIGTTEKEQSVSTSGQGSSSGNGGDPSRQIYSEPKSEWTGLKPVPTNQNIPESESKPEPNQEPIKFPDIPSPKTIAKKISSIIAGAKTKTETTTPEIIKIKKETKTEEPELEEQKTSWLLIIFFIILIIIILILIFKKRT